MYLLTIPVYIQEIAVINPVLRYICPLSQAAPLTPTPHVVLDVRYKYSVPIYRRTRKIIKEVPCVPTYLSTLPYVP